MVKNNLRSSRERSVSESLQPSQTVAQDAKCPSAGKVRGEHELPIGGISPSVVVRRWESYVQASSEVSASVGSCFLVVPDFSLTLSCNSRRGGNAKHTRPVAWIRHDPAPSRQEFGPVPS